MIYNKHFFVAFLLFKAVISIGFHERQHQYFEYEKYDEWVVTRPGENMIDFGMFLIIIILPSTSTSDIIWSIFSPFLDI